LDGKGHKSASGVHGTRGYEGEYIFNWIGGTTPILSRTDSIMAQLGNRLLRYEIVGEEQTEDDLMEYARSFEPAKTEDKCKRLVNQFLTAHFEQYGINSVEQASIRIRDCYLREIVRLAMLTATGRVELAPPEDPTGDWTKPSEPEGPHRLILLLRTFACGLAL